MLPAYRGVHSSRGCVARSRASRRGRRPAARRARPAAARRADERRPPCATGAPLRAQRRGTRSSASCASRGLQHRARPGERAAHAQARRAAGWEPGASAWTGYGEDDGYTDADREAKAAFVREAGRAGGGAWHGTSARTTATIRGSPPTSDCVRWRWTPTTRRSSCSTARCATTASAASCRSSSTSATRRRGSAGAGAERLPLADRGRPELGAMPGARAPPRDHAQCPARRGGRMAGRPRRRAVVEFPTREDPMVQGLLAAKREDAHGDYELERLRAAARGARSSPPARGVPSGTRVLLEASPRGA